jgi:hypothetical protein
MKRLGQATATLAEVSTPHPFPQPSETIELSKEQHFSETRVAVEQLASTLQWDS